jgi:hypothetical protein
VSLLGVVDVLDDRERARYPGSLKVEAYFDGWNQAVGHTPITFPRFLDRAEEQEWRLGFADGRQHRDPDPEPEPDKEPAPEPALEVVQVHPGDTTGPLPDWYTDAEPSDLAPYPPVDGSQPCAQTDPEAWFPEKGRSPDDARRMCGRCTFLEQCRDYALDRPYLLGVWGGTSMRERQRLRRERSGAAA